MTSILCNTTYRIINNLPCIRFITPQIQNILHKNMSVIVNNIQQTITDVQKPVKRQLEDDGNEIVGKTRRIEEAKSQQSTKEHLKRRNFVIMLGYLGKNYFGMQINRGIKTIEEGLLTALLKANFITKEQFEDLRELKFQRAARTDRGVSAVRQIVSLKLPEQVNKEEINEHLPDDIRVFGIKRVTKTFNSKNKCDARTYRYVLPTHALAPEDSKFLEIGQDEEIDAEKRLEELSTIDGKPYNEFRLSTEMFDKLQATLKLLEGTHNFHNFTSKTKPMDPRAKRYIMYFQCVETFVADGMEFAVLEVKGQSFMLHQIRKMVSLVIGICRNLITSEIVKDVFSLERIDVPTAPGLGLSLHFVHYTHYDKKYGKDGIHEALDWKECEEEVEKFYKEYILRDILDTEMSEKVMLNWLASFLTPKRFALKDPAAQCEYIL